MRLWAAAVRRVVPTVACAAALALEATGAPAVELVASVVDESSRPIADAVVYAVPAHAAPPVSGKVVVVDQVNKEFVPHVSVVQTGTAVSFPNKDNIRHHVYSFSPAKVFTLKLYSGVPSSPVVFDKPGEVSLGCNIHDRMAAFILVVDTPYFGRTGADGTLRLRELPSGDYEMHAWSPESGVGPAQTVHVRAASASVRLSLSAVTGRTPGPARPAP